MLGTQVLGSLAQWLVTDKGQGTMVSQSAIVIGPMGSRDSAGYRG